MRFLSRRIIVLLHDLFMVAAAWVLAFLIRYNFAVEPTVLAALAASLPVVVLSQSVVLWAFRLYRSLWRFASIPDLWNIIRAALVGTLLAVAALFLFNRLQGLPRSVFVVYPMLVVVLLGAPRLIYRMWKDHGLNPRRFTGFKSVLIIGAGRAGEMLARDMKRDGDYQPVGFLDDNPKLKGSRIHGLPVLGQVAALENIVGKSGVDVIVIAMPSASSEQMQRIVEMCERVKIPFRTLPKLDDLVVGDSTLNALREVKIEDLLGREPVSLDWKQISEGLLGKTVLVSGGGGSIGSELCRQIGRLGPQRLVIFDQSEFNLYSIEMELRQQFPSLPLMCLIGDVCDSVTVEHVFSTYRPDVVFHAAAYKHVPLLQSQVREAIHNNVLGTRNLALAADKFGVKTFVMISTDKAVNPANIMGGTKRIAELFCQGLNRNSSTHFITVRFGNVLGSAGSVVPLFQKQIQAGGPVTVTHPDITRYFMTIPEACQLIMQAAAMGKGGEIFVLDMGSPVRISYLAEQMIRLTGKIPGRDIEIVYTGLRPGEKLFEELFYDQENLAPTWHEKIMLAQSSETDWNVLRAQLERVEAACADYDEETLATIVRELVPGMHDREPDQPTTIPSNVIPLRKSQP